MPDLVALMTDCQGFSVAIVARPPAAGRAGTWQATLPLPLGPKSRYCRSDHHPSRRGGVPWITRSNTFSTSPSCRGSGTTSSRTCPRRPRRRCTRAPASRSGPMTWRRCSPWRSSPRKCRQTDLSTFRSRWSTSTGCGGPRRCTARGGWRRRSVPRPGSTTSTRGPARPARTSPTPPCPRRTTTPPRASRSSPRRPAPASGAARWRSRRRCTGSTAKCGWSGRPTTRSPTAGC